MKKNNKKKSNKIFKIAIPLFILLIAAIGSFILVRKYTVDPFTDN